MNAAIWLAALVTITVVAAQDPTKQDRTLYLNEQQSFTPGYAVGDIALGDPAVADFKVLPGRRELLLFGKSAGKTTLTIWDQRGVKRHELLITVADRKMGETERELRELLKGFPGLEVHTLAGSLAITGTVTTDTDREAIEKIAGAAGAQNLVRYNPPPKQATVTNPMPQPTGSAPLGGADAGGAGSSGTAASAPKAAVEYELEVLEASVLFRSGSYATGVEPSGRSLFKQTVRVPIDKEGEVFVPGTAVAPKDVKSKPNQAGQAGQEVGLHLKLRPAPPEESGSFVTYLLIETNVPVGQVTDTGVMRRARWQFSAASGEPIGIGGAELLAVADTSRGPSGLSRTAGAASFWAALPGVSSVKGANYASSIPYYDPQRKTQLLLVVHPRLVQAAK